MKFNYIIIFIICGLITTNALALSPESEIVTETYEKLKLDCHNKSYQDEYLNVFPKNADEFVKIFDPKDFGELYNTSFEYIQILKCVLQEQPKETLTILLTIAKDVPHGSDAPEYLDNVIVYACHKTPECFIQSMRTLDAYEMGRVVNLLADHEAIDWSPDYQECIDILKTNDAGDIARIFEEEREVRMRQPHD